MISLLFNLEELIRFQIFRYLKKFFRLFSKRKEYAMPHQLWLNIVIDRLPKPFFLLDLQKKRITFSNASARRMMGMDYSENPANQSYPELFQLYDLNNHLVAIENLPSARVFNGEKIEGEEFLLVSGTGRFNIKIFSEEIPSAEKNLNSALIIFQDITSLKKVEMDLRRTQGDLNEAVKIAQLGFWSLDTSTQKVTVSTQLVQQFGLNPDSFSGDLEDALAVIHPQDRIRVSEAIQNSLINRAPYHIEYRVVHPDRSIKWIEAKSGNISDKMNNDPTRFTGTTIDITERVKARQIQEASEHELRRLADSMPQIVWSADRNGQIDYFNRVWFNYSGSNYEESKGLKWMTFIHPDDSPITFEKWNAAIEEKHPFENDFRLRSKGGEYRWHVSRAVPIFDSNNRVEKWYGTNTDIHDQKLSSEKIEEAWATAEKANSAKSQFLANMSHEIRTPLGAIMGFSELIKDKDLDYNEREQYISVIERNSSQLMRIIDDILDLSKVEAGMMSIEYIEFSLPEILTDFSSLMGLKAREKGIAFISKAVTKLPSKIICDPTRLRQILMNVIGNAIKFTDEGKVELRVSYHDDFLEFEVEDTGRGITSEHAENLFQSFVQADSSTTRKYGGTGLGLVLTRSLAEAMGGSFILRESEIDKGSVFVVRIRAVVSPNATFFSGLGFESLPLQTHSNYEQLKGVKILLVEDSPDNQALISIHLTRAGAKVDIASNGHQGIQMALASEYQIILMDVQMPLMDGMTAVEILRARGYSKPIVALTAHAMKEERVRCLQAGFTDFLSKPVTRDDLIKVALNYNSHSKFNKSETTDTKPEVF